MISVNTVAHPSTPNAQVKQSLGSTNIVLAFRELLASGTPEEHEAIAFAVHMLSENVQANVLEYFSCRTNELAAVLASVLSSGTDAARFAAVNALRNLAGNGNNRCALLCVCCSLCMVAVDGGQWLRHLASHCIEAEKHACCADDHPSFFSFKCRSSPGCPLFVRW